jgi:hypothetical protein
VSFKEHLSERTLESLLKKELPLGGAAGLHLSYCPVCRERKDEIALKLAAQRMWEAYELTDAAAGRHVEDATLRKFWLGELRDDELKKQISAHCVECRDCRRRRELARATLEPVGEGAPAPVGLLSAAASFIRSRPYTTASAVLAAALLVGMYYLLFNRRQTGGLPGDKSGDAVVIVPTVTPRNDNSSPKGPKRDKHDGDISKNVQPSPTPQQDAAPRDLLARAQTLDLKHAPDGTEARSPSEAGVAEKVYLKVKVSRSGPTLLHIGLPANSKKGLYEVSVRDAAYLNKIVAVKGKSTDGASLHVVVDIRGLKPGEYVLRVTRQASKEGGDEYIGDYNLLVKSPAPAGHRPAKSTRASEK